MAKSKTFTARVAGTSYLVVESKATNEASYWITRDTEGNHQVHLGKLVDAPFPTKVLDVAKPCSRCKALSWAGTSRGRAVHDGCEGWLDTMTDEAFAQVVFETAVEVGVPIADPTSTALQRLAQKLGARTPLKASLTLPASRVNPRVVAGLRKAAGAHPGGLQCSLRLFNAGQTVELDLPHLVSPAIIPKLNKTFGPDSASLRSP